MKIKSAVVGSILLLGAAKAMAAENRNCGQPFRQITITTAHALAGLICNLHANNATEKLTRTLGNSINFVHKWNVAVTNDSFVIDATCSTVVRYYDRNDSSATIVHPGFRLNLSLPRNENLCDPLFKGKLTELHQAQSTSDSSYTARISDNLAARVTALNTRDVILKFQDSGARNAHTGEYTGDRSLRHLSIGSNLISMLRSGFSGGSMNQGYQSDENKMAIGDGQTMSYGQFFGYERFSAVIPDFSRISSRFQFNKATDASTANRDLLSISGLSGNSFYIRQNIAPQAYDDAKLSLNYDGGTSAFYIRREGRTADAVEVVGCTDYSYNSDFNHSQSMTINDCRQRVRSLRVY